LDIRDKDIVPRDPELPYTDWQKEVGKKWATLTDLQKKPYFEAAAAEFAKYKEDLTKWELKMVRLGNSDLVREKAMIEKSPLKPKRTPKQKAPVSSDSD
jgi:hypothetical protein